MTALLSMCVSSFSFYNPKRSTGMKKDLIDTGNGAKELLQHLDTASASHTTFFISCLPTPRAIGDNRN
jgi:hypothetical protein